MKTFVLCLNDSGKKKKRIHFKKAAPVHFQTLFKKIWTCFLSRAAGLLTYLHLRWTGLLHAEKNSPFYFPYIIYHIEAYLTKLNSGLDQSFSSAFTLSSLCSSNTENFKSHIFEHWKVNFYSLKHDWVSFLLKGCTVLTYNRTFLQINIFNQI